MSIFIIDVRLQKDVNVGVINKKKQIKNDHTIDQLSKLESIIGNKIQTISIDMPNQKLYDLFYISRNNTATKILDYIASKLKEITLNDLTSVISKQSPDVKTLFDYDGFN